MFGRLEKSKGEAIRPSFSFFVLALVLSVTFFLVFLGNFRYYRTQIAIIYIPKSEAFATHTPYVMENLVRLPKMLAFYEKMTRDNSNISDQFAGKPQDEKKELWNQMLKVEKDDGSSIVKIEVTSRDKESSLILAKQTARTLFDTTSFYYNIKTDANLRVADEPITLAIIKNWFWLVLASVIFGLVGSYLLQLISAKISFDASSFKNLRRPDILTEDILDEEYMPEIDKETIREMEKKAQAWVKQSHAPSNLPIAQVGEPEVEMEIPEIKDEVRQDFGEPTEEELKKRLNQLLRGEL
jgi:hypothetical protein